MFGRALRAHPLAWFFTLAWLLSWLFMVPLALARHGFLPPLPSWLHYLSAYGPLAAAAICSYATGGRAELRAWGSRLVHGRARARWWLLASSPLALYLGAAAVQRISSGSWPDIGALGRVSFLPDLGLGVIPLWLLNSGLGEEAGWRGYALPALQRRFSSRVASLWIAAGWFVWHVPAIFYLPAYERLGPGALVGFAAGLTSGSFLLTWLANGAGGSALLPIVWHGAFNLVTAPPASGGMVAAFVSTGTMMLGVLGWWRLTTPAMRRGRSVG
jgi:CAAX protease family protein